MTQEWKGGLTMIKSLGCDYKIVINFLLYFFVLSAIILASILATFYFIPTESKTQKEYMLHTITPNGIELYLRMEEEEYMEFLKDNPKINITRLKLENQ
jgi:hypothetical protein